MVLALVTLLQRHIHPEAESGIEGHYLMLMASSEPDKPACVMQFAPPGDPFTHLWQIFNQLYIYYLLQG